MKQHGGFVMGLVVGVLLATAVGARAGWNDQAMGPDRALVEKLVNSGEESARRLRELVDVQKDLARATQELTRATSDNAHQQAETSRAIHDAAQRCH